MIEIVAALVTDVLLTADPVVITDAICRGVNVKLLDRKEAEELASRGSEYPWKFLANAPTLFCLTEEGWPFSPVDLSHGKPSPLKVDPKLG